MNAQSPIASTFPLSVPQSFYETVVMATDKFTADILLYGAHLYGDELTFRTFTAYDCAFERPLFMQLATGLKLKLKRPESPFQGKDERPTAAQARKQMRYDD